MAAFDPAFVRVAPTPDDPLLYVAFKLLDAQREQAGDNVNLQK